MKTEAYKLYSTVFRTFLPNLHVFWDTVYYGGDIVDSSMTLATLRQEKYRN